jgi:hypothetical protein
MSAEMYISWQSRWTTTDEIGFMLSLAKRGKWAELETVASLIPHRRWDAGVDVERLRTKAAELLSRRPGGGGQ